MSVCRFRLPAVPRVGAAPPLRWFHTPGKIKVNIVVQDGTALTFDTPVGISLMEAIRDVAQLDMDVSCNKLMRCAVCHVYVDAAWSTKLPSPCEKELDILDQVLDPRDTSRLSCQIELTDDHDGIAVTLPKSKKDLTKL